MSEGGRERERVAGNAARTCMDFEWIFVCGSCVDFLYGCMDFFNVQMLNKWQFHVKLHVCMFCMFVCICVCMCVCVH